MNKHLNTQQGTLQGGKVRVQVKANPDGESFVIFNNGEATAVEGMTGALLDLCRVDVLVLISRELEYLRPCSGRSPDHLSNRYRQSLQTLTP